MDNIDEKWLRINGWEKTFDETEITETNKIYTTKSRHIVYEYRPQNHIYARIDRTTYVSRYNDDNSIRKRRTYYMFSASNEKTGFRVENRICHHRFNDSQIKAAVAVVS